MSLSKSIVGILACAVLTVSAQNPTTLRVDVRLVNVVATVTDASGKFVPNLTADDFTVLEDGVPQKISHFSQDREVPVSVGILLDTSGSMIEKMRAAIEAVDRFVKNIHKDDDIFLMTFSGRITLEQDFTNDRVKLSRALNSLSVGGGTVLFDALNRAIDKVHEGKHDKKAILLISDGIDQGSRSTTMETLLGAIRGSEVLVYGLGATPQVYADPAEHVPFTLPTPSSVARGPQAPAAPRRGNNNMAVNMTVLNQFATNSGGQAFLLSSTFIDSGTSNVDKILTTIAEELRGQYTLGYYPSAPDDGRFHTIKVTSLNRKQRTDENRISGPPLAFR
jgi:VWFA-related protein